MTNKMKWMLFLVLVVGLAACSGSARSGKGCGCPQKAGMVGY